MKVIRNAAGGMAPGAFGSWAEVIDRAWQLGAQHPQHPVSDGNGTIAAGIGLVYVGERGTSCACFTCCGSAGGTLGRRGLRRRGGCWTRAVWRKVGNGQGGLCGRRSGRRVTGVSKRCAKDCVIWRWGGWRIGRGRVWSGTIVSCGGGSSWGRYGRSTTCWRCCRSRAWAAKQSKTKRYRAFRASVSS